MRLRGISQTEVWMCVWILVTIVTTSAVLKSPCLTELRSFCGVLRLPLGREIQLVPRSLRNISHTPYKLLKSLGNSSFICTLPVPTLKDDGEWNTTQLITSHQATITHETTTGISVQITGETGGTTTPISTHIISGKGTSEAPAPATESTAVLGTDVTKMSSEATAPATESTAVAGTDVMSTEAPASATESTAVPGTDVTQMSSEATAPATESTAVLGTDVTKMSSEATTPATESTAVPGTDLTQMNSDGESFTDVTTTEGYETSPLTSSLSTKAKTDPTSTSVPTTKNSSSLSVLCPSNFVLYGPKCYHFPPVDDVTSYMNYTQAKDYCFSEVSTGMADVTPLTINSLDENTFLVDVLQDVVDITGNDLVWVNCDPNERFDCIPDSSLVNQPLNDICTILSLIDGLWYGVDCSYLAFVVCQFIPDVDWSSSSEPEFNLGIIGIGK
ncbi:mucin-17-like [Lytechinus variegatus]|uniref:mucin-17-like n=1 Tax=Lytechinus variegatus TaxID=7654 RepID=UPI001BB1433B|nr:mucin-17-like [Lytechinus variegatus]